MGYLGLSLAFFVSFLLPFPSSAMYDLSLDFDSGELVKPVNWSDARFHLVKMIRLRELLQETLKGVSKDPELFPEESNKKFMRNSRRKRSVDVANIGLKTAPYVAQGLYRQERLLLPKLISPPVQFKSVNADLFFGRYEGKEVTADLMFEVSLSGNIQVIRVTKPESGPFEFTSLSGKFDVDLGSSGIITDVVLGSCSMGNHFVAVAVKTVLVWPASVDAIVDTDGDGSKRDEADYMSINDPVEMPDTGRSRIYSFELSEDFTKFTSTLGMTIPTIEAVDAEFWMEDDELYLSVAHRGNYTTLTENTESILLKYESHASDKFKIVQGYQGVDSSGDQIPTDLSLVTHNPKSVIQFNINSRSFLVFASYNATPYTGSEDTFSPIFRYNLNSGLYDIVQQLPTFHALDVSFFEIPDPSNPLNTQSFLVFANNQDLASNPIESFIFKYTDGQFLPFQGLLINKPISVTTVAQSTTTDYEGATVDAMKHYIVFLTEAEDLVFYQFDGTRFNLVLTSNTPGATDVDTVMLTDIPTLLVRFASKDELCDVGYDMGIVYNPIFDSSQAIRSYVSYWTHMDNRLDFPALQKKLDSAPNPDDTVMSLTDAEFQGNFNVENIIIDPDLIPADVGGEPALEVASKTVINADMITAVEMLVDGVETLNENNMASLKTILDNYKAKIEVSAKLDQENVLAQNVHFNEIQVLTTLSTDNTDIDVEGSVVTHDGSKMVDLVSFMKNSVELSSGPTIPVVLTEDMVFENIRFEGDYSITQINEANLQEYVKLEDNQKIGKTITFNEAAFFKNAVTVVGTVDGVEFSSSKMLLKNGEQTIDDAVILKGGVDLTDLRTEVINGFDLGILKTALLTGGESITATGINTLVVDELEIAGKVITVEQIGVLESTTPYNKLSTVHLEDLVTASMKKSTVNTISLKYNFDEDVSVDGDVAINSANTLNNLNFPSDFISISDSVETLSSSGTLVLSGNTVVEPGVSMTVKSNGMISSGTWTLSDSGSYVAPTETQDVSVDSDGNLDLLLLAPTSISNYQHIVSAKKTFDSVLFNENVISDGTVLGYSLNQAVSDGVQTYSEDLSVSDLVLTGEQQIISSLVLDNDILQTSCTLQEGETIPVDAVVSCTSSNNFATVYDKGVKREDTSLPATITSITFSGAASFEQNLDISSLNTLDSSISYVSVNPDTDFLRKSGTGTIAFTQPMVFTDQTTFRDNIAQTVDAEVKVCELGFNGQCLCSDCANDMCQSKGQVCLVRSHLSTDDSLYANTVGHKLSFINDNSLKITGDQEILPRLVLKGGFQADLLEVTTDDCTINSVACNRIALTTSDQTFTGFNKFYGSINTAGSVQVNTELTVTGTVDMADTATIYSDTLLKETTDSSVQTVSGHTTITQDFTVNALTTNGVQLLGIDVNPADMYSADYVLRTDDAAIITSNIEFAEKPSLGQFSASNPDTVTWDGVLINKFFNNLWIEGLDQTIKANVVIEQNLHLSKGLSTSQTDTEGNELGVINHVEIVDMENRALRISGDDIPEAKRNLKDTNFVILESTAADGINLEGHFLGIDLSLQAVESKNNDNLVFTVAKTFSSVPTVAGNLELIGNIVPISGDQAAIPQDDLWNFLKNDPSVKKIQVTSASGASSTNEPTIDAVNLENLNSLRTSKWYRKDDVDLPYPVTFADAQFTSKLHATHLNQVDLVAWRDSYLSLSKAQDIRSKYTFSEVLFDVPVSVGKVFIGVPGTEGDLITETKTHKFVDHYFKVLFRNITYTSIAAVLSPASVDVSAAVIMIDDHDVLIAPLTLNNIDLSKDVLTYKTGDSKVFTEKVAITGDLVVIPGTEGNGDLQFLDTTVYLYQTAPAGIADHNIGSGLELSDGIYMVQPTVLDNEAVKMLEGSGSEIEITGDITITATPTFSDLTISSTFNGEDIGTCASPNILTTNNCGTSGDQTVTGSVQFGTDDNNVDLTFDTILGSSLVTVNDVDWQTLMDKMIFKSQVGRTVLFTGEKIFNEDISIASDVLTTISSTVFGLDLGSVQADAKGNTDMKYPSDEGVEPPVPKLTDALETITANSAVLPSEFLYMQPILAESMAQMRVRTLCMLNAAVDQNAWDSSPFHLASLAGDTTTGEVELWLTKISFESGIAKVSMVAVDTQTFNIVDGDLGDMESLYYADNYLYFLSTRSSTFDDTKPTDILAFAADADATLESSDISTYHNFVYVWDAETQELVVRQFFKETIMDLEPMVYKTTESSRNCTVSCGEQSRVYCPKSDSLSDNVKVYLTSVQNFPDESDNPIHSINTEEQELSITPDSCFQASSTNFALEEDMLALARGKETSSGRVDIYKSGEVEYIKIQTISCYFCSFANLGSFYDQILEVNRIFLVIVSYKADFAYVGEYKTDKFEAYQRLDVSLPTQAIFYTQGSSIYLSVLSGLGTAAKSTTFILQGSMGFLPVPDWTLSLPGVTSHDVFSHPSLETILLSTTGKPFPHLSTGVTANTVMQALYKQSNVGTIRSQVVDKLTPMPSYISLQCSQMVTDYATRLFKDSQTSVEMYAKLLLRLLFRPYIQFSTSSFSQEVQAVLAEPPAEFLVDPNPANAVVNLYYYQGDTFVRDFTDLGYAGTAFVYQDLDGVLYIYARIKDDHFVMSSSKKYRQVSFWTSCDEDATELSSAIFSTPNLELPDHYNPVETPNTDTITQNLCMMVHDFERKEKLKTIKGKDWVAAIRVADNDGNRLACGLMKHPEQAMVQFLNDHEEGDISFHPFGSNF